MRRRRFAAIVFALAVAVAPAAARTKIPDFIAGGPVELGAVIDGETLNLADGRVVRLVGIDVPAAAPDLARRSKDALARLVAGKPLELRFAGSAQDRHGRVMAQLFAGGRWVQRELLSRGLARVHGAADERLGLAEMLAAEDAARRARRGLWRSPLFAVRPAADAGADSGSFQIVTGTVADAAPVAGGVYVNFGADWHNAFSLHIGGDALKLCRAAGLDPLALTGARLRVRGFIDGTRRPTIEVTYPEQIERL